MHQAQLVVPTHLDVNAQETLHERLFHTLRDATIRNVLYDSQYTLAAVEDFFLSDRPANTDSAPIFHRVIIFHANDERSEAIELQRAVMTRPHLRQLPSFEARAVEAPGFILDDVVRTSSIADSIMKMGHIRFILSDLANARSVLDLLCLSALPISKDSFGYRLASTIGLSATVAYRYAYWLLSGYNVSMERFSQLLVQATNELDLLRMSVIDVGILTNDAAEKARSDELEYGRNLQKLLHDRHGSLMNVFRLVIAGASLLITARIIQPLAG